MLMTRDLGQYENILPAVFLPLRNPGVYGLDRPMGTHPLVAFWTSCSVWHQPHDFRCDGVVEDGLLLPEDVTLADYREALAETGKPYVS